MMILQYIINQLRHLNLHQDHDYREINQVRLQVIIIFFFIGFAALSFRLLEIVLFKDKMLYTYKDGLQERVVTRAEIFDRNGELVAVNLVTPSLYARPAVIIDAHDAASKVIKVFPELNYKNLLNDLKSNKKFIWIKRNLTPKEQFEVNNLGIPGLYFEREEKRVYPHKSLLSHVLGYVDRDGSGISGLEKYLDDKLKSNNNEKIKLSIDIRAQTIVYEELNSAIREFNATGGVGVIMDANNGELVSMVSLPDFDPHKPGLATNDQLFNKASLGLYEMGSIFKAYTMAAALESKTISINDAFMVDAPIKIARFNIRDYHARVGSLSVPEIFMYSSNIGIVKIGLEVGKHKQKNFLKKLGILDPLEIELPEKASPIFPSGKNWSDINTVTISYGYGVAVTPLHVVKSIAPLVNGGKLTPITLIKTNNEDLNNNKKVLSPSTSKYMKKLFRLALEKGTGKRADVPGYLIGGKTSTANKSEKGNYNKSLRVSSFVGIYPINNPKYIVLIMLDDPKGNKQTNGLATAGITSATAVGNIIARTAPILGVHPIDNLETIKKDMQIDYISNKRDIF